MKRSRLQKPFFKNKPEALKRRTQTNLLATSKATGLRHEFGNIKGWEDTINELERRAAVQPTQIFGSLSFYNWLSSQKIDLSYLENEYQDFGYRYAHPKFGPLAIAGNLAMGGRFNIGGAQLDKNFPSLKMFSCLYIASSEECAIEEAVKPLGGLQMYKLKPKRTLKLWDLQKVITKLNYPNLDNQVESSHGEKIWAYQKFPIESQILSHYLKNLGGDGIFFGSTKLDGHKNIALFFTDDADAKNNMEIVT